MPRDEKDEPLRSAKAFLEGLNNRPRQPWDELHEERTPEPPAPAPPNPPAPRQPADDAMSQAERIAARNRDFAKRTRYLRKD
jgi:hypothetical protein